LDYARCCCVLLQETHGRNWKGTRCVVVECAMSEADWWRPCRTISSVKAKSVSPMTTLWIGLLLCAAHLTVSNEFYSFISLSFFIFYYHPKFHLSPSVSLLLFNQQYTTEKESSRSVFSLNFMWKAFRVSVICDTKQQPPCI
jgi:hypothetical protein